MKIPSAQPTRNGFLIVTCPCRTGKNADCRRNVGKTEKMRSRRRKRRGSGLWPGAVAVLAAGMVYAARTEILDLAKTGVDLVVDDDHQENSAEKPDLSVTENSDAAADGEETLTDAGANSTDETGADRKYMDADSEISADGSGEQEFIELPSSYDLRERRAIRVSDQGDLGTCWAFAALKAVETSMPESMAVPLSADHMSIHNSFGISQNSGGDYSMRWPTFSPGRDLSRRRTIHMGTAPHRTVLHRSVMSRRSGSCKRRIMTR